MKKSYIVIIIFGILLAVFAVVLQLLEYRYIVGSLSTDAYTLLVAVIFTAVGIWIGINLLKKNKVEALRSEQLTSQKRNNFNLNNRECEILQLIAKGHTNQEIADILYLALPTIKTHISNLYRKLEVRNRTEAINKAQSVNLLNGPQSYESMI